MMRKDEEKGDIMALDFTNNLQVGITLVANEFIDTYMAGANGEYVKVYLFLVRHSDMMLEVTTIADALNHTESDVKRALAYWKKLGVLKTNQDSEEKAEEKISVSTSAAAPVDKGQSRSPYTAADLLRLKQDDEFSQLIYIAEKLMNKMFTPRECEVFAYLYDGLKLSVELLEYLVEYCVQIGHTSIRYIERVALNWYEKGLLTVETAKAYSEGFMKDSYAVMKAFGLTERSPGDSEKAMIDKWYRTYGFSKELVVEACNRTLEATHKPSFQYADKILSEWKKQGVKSMGDIKALDQKRQPASSRTPAKNKSSNQFHNFNQRDTDYDALILQGLKD